ncbi:mitochondrial folate carrier protein [Botrytis cinerea]
MTENHARISPALVETIAGLSAGTASTLAVHPLDVIKTRLQIHRSTSHTPASGLTIFRSLTQQPQPLQSLYRGLTPNLIGNASSWALFFYFKNIFESSLRSFHNQPSNSNYASLTPIDYFSHRMLSSDRSSKGAYQSMWHGARHLWQHEGPRGFYRGVGISLLGNSHGAVQFAVYEPLKNFWRNHCSHQTLRGDRESSQVKLGNTATLLLSSSAKLLRERQRIRIRL